MEEIDMTEEEQIQETQEPSPKPEGAEVQSVKDTALEARTALVEQELVDIKTKQVAQERAGLLERAAELELSEEEFEGQSNEAIAFALEVAKKVKMSTLRGSDPDIPLGEDGKPQERTEKEVVDTYYDWKLE